MITLPFRQTHLPVDAVLEADGVGRSAEDRQLQNETLDEKRQQNQATSALFHWKRSIKFVFHKHKNLTINRRKLKQKFSSF